jgi:hypothetical protein
MPTSDLSRSQLDLAAWEATLTEGKAMSMETAVEYALSENEHAVSASGSIASV